MAPHIVVGLRHLEDHNELARNLFDAPLKGGQEAKAQEMGKEILQILKREGLESIKIYVSPQMRAIETATLVYEYLHRKIPVTIVPEKALRELDQGIPALPRNYKDGDYLPALPVAWDVFCDESYKNKNLSYKFGQPVGTNQTHQKLVGAFERYGECMLDMLPRQYEFFERLIAGELQDENQLLILCSHNTTLLTLCELIEISKKVALYSKNLNPKDLAYDCWNVFLEEGGSAFPEKLAFGQTLTYNLAQIRSSNFLEHIANARLYYAKVRKKEAATMEQILQVTDNDYTKASKIFKRHTKRELDDKEALDTSAGFYPVSVVIPYYKDKLRIVNTLKAIEQQNLTKKEKQQVEVVIVDDGSFDNLIHFIKNAKYSFNLEVVYSKTNMGRAWARNIGARTAKNSTLLFIDSDVMLAGNYLREHAVRNHIAPNNVYISLANNVDDISPLLKRLRNKQTLEVPFEFNDYRVEDKIKAGAMGIYKVKENVTVRLLESTPPEQTRFHRAVAVRDDDTPSLIGQPPLPERLLKFNTRVVRYRDAGQRRDNIGDHPLVGAHIRAATNELGKFNPIFTDSDTDCKRRAIEAVGLGIE